jgi:hypothetical protein
MKKLVHLSSVGCFYDPKTETTYPEMDNGKPDLESPMHLTECSEEFHSKISIEDHKKLIPKLSTKKFKQIAKAFLAADDLINDLTNDETERFELWLDTSYAGKNQNSYERIKDYLEQKTDQEDLLNDYENLPEDLKAILETFNEDEERYSECARIQAELEQIGYTYDYGLDGEPYHLRKLKTE